MKINDDILFYSITLVWIDRISAEIYLHSMCDEMAQSLHL